VPDEAGVYPLLHRVRYQRTGLAIEISLVLSYMGEEYVATELVSEDGSGSLRRTQIGSGTAHTGYQSGCPVEIPGSATTCSRSAGGHTLNRR
jgi:hypothetical protein